MYSICMIIVVTNVFHGFVLQVKWEPYQDIEVLQLGVSTMCSADEDLYKMRCLLICFYAVEWHLPHRVARQFGLRHEWLVEPFSTSVELDK